ncbi:MAG: 16S rRNA (guanine(527)-N(7))-methyltransferase RsmG [Candidatus Peribacteraceae bacterium]
MHLDNSQTSALIQAFLAENAKLNLSAFRTEEHCRIGNIQDSLTILDHVKPEMIMRVADLGTGGGFPLLPLAMAMPHSTFVGIDSIDKKVQAVRRITAAVSLTNVTVLSGRIEEIAQRPDMRGTFDLVTARALAPLAVLLEYAMPLLKVGGTAAFWKSTKIADELASTAEAQKTLRCAYSHTFTYTLPGDWGDRCIVFFQKKADTPEAYPRKTGTPKSDPL